MTADIAFGRAPETWLDYDPGRSRPARGPAAVATANPLASWAAASILRDGGSAVDAAIAAQMVLCAVEPNASGLGGGAMLLLHHQGQVTAIEGLSAAPGRVTDRLDRDFDGRTIPAERALFGGRAVGVPGALKALELAYQRHGRLPWARLFEPAVALCTDGFPLSPYLWRTLQEQVPMRDEPFARATFGVGDAVLPPGAVLRNPALARTLRRIATGGAAELYEGETATAILRTLAADPLPGVMTLADLRAYRAIEKAPVRFPLGGLTVAAGPLPAFGGTAVGQIVGLAQRAGLSGLDRLPGPDAIHVLAECGRLAFAARNSYAGDPGHERCDALPQLDPATLDRLARRIHPGRTGDAVAREPTAGDSMTSHLCTADGDGLVVSMTTTLNQNFGARLAVEGFYLNNVQTNFSAIPQAGGKAVLNAMAAGKRPRTTFAPAIVTDAAGAFVAAVGGAGGYRIIGYVANALLRLVSGERDPQAIVSAPHALNWSGATEIERPLAACIPELVRRGHYVITRRMDGGTQCITAGGDGFAAGGDPRRDGAGMACQPIAGRRPGPAPPPPQGAALPTGGGSGTYET